MNAAPSALELKAMLKRTLTLFLLLFLSSIGLFAQDNDGDGVLDIVDLDDDNDGILDQYDCQFPVLNFGFEDSPTDQGPDWIRVNTTGQGINTFNPLQYVDPVPEGLQYYEINA